jgi:hypothetical protein
MSKKIIISADEEIVCPECDYHFSLSTGINRQTIESYESEFEVAIANQKKELETTTNALIEKVKLDSIIKARAEFDSEKLSLAEELVEKNKKLADFRAQELDLRKQKRELEDQQANFKIEIERKLEDERLQITKQICATESERFMLKEADYKKKIEDAQKANEVLTRKLSQGSQQLQGEVFELEIENTLNTAFVHDLIDEVKKGQRGADVLQIVKTPNGQVCGKIIWEAKRAENWTDKWIQKLKDDQQEAKADIAVLVSTVMPKGVTDVIVRIGDVWVISLHVVKPVAELLRATLIETNKMKLMNTGRDEKMELLYNYLASVQFSQKIRTLLESFASMRNDLDAEKRAIQRLWAKREMQIERVTSTMTNVVGELQGIAHEALPQLESIETLGLEAPDSDDSNLRYDN